MFMLIVLVDGYIVIFNFVWLWTSLIGRVGKLSIKIPWKKLGRDPIVIILEDIFVCTSRRDDEEVIFNLKYVYFNRL